MDIRTFATLVPKLYHRYSWEGKYHRKRGHQPDCFANGFPWMTALETRLSLKARNGCALDIEDLVEIAEWGGGQHGLPARVREQNTPEAIRKATARACANLSNPEEALGCLLEAINQWGLTYASKTLMFMCPRDYPAIDGRLRKGLARLLPAMYDGKSPVQIRSQIKGYLTFIEICRDIQSRMESPGPRKGGWFLADIERALFRFVSEGHRF